jgi:hypothetical protein
MAGARVVLTVERTHPPSLVAPGQLTPLVKCHELDFALHSVNVDDAEKRLRAQGMSCAHAAERAAPTVARKLERRVRTVAKLGEIDDMHTDSCANVQARRQRTWLWKLPRATALRCGRDSLLFWRPLPQGNTPSPATVVS